MRYSTTTSRLGRPTPRDLVCRSRASSVVASGGIRTVAGPRPPRRPGPASLEIRIPGDSNLDGRFDQLDIVVVLQPAKYLTGQPATFVEGDWNGDGVFDPLDIVAALADGRYSPGPAAADSVFAALSGE